MPERTGSSKKRVKSIGTSRLVFWDSLEVIYKYQLGTQRYTTNLLYFRFDYGLLSLYNWVPKLYYCNISQTMLINATHLNPYSVFWLLHGVDGCEIYLWFDKPQKLKSRGLKMEGLAVPETGPPLSFQLFRGFLVQLIWTSVWIVWKRTFRLKSIVFSQHPGV